MRTEGFRRQDEGKEGGIRNVLWPTPFHEFSTPFSYVTRRTITNGIKFVKFEWMIVNWLLIAVNLAQTSYHA